MMMEEDLHSIESSLAGFTDIAGSPSSFRSPTFPGIQLAPGQTKYGQLLAVIEEMGRDLRPSYAGSRSSAERLKRGIVHARILVRECLMETERSARQ